MVEQFPNRAICVDGTPAGYGVYTFSGEVEGSKGIGEGAWLSVPQLSDMNVVKAHLNTNLYKSYLSKYPSRTNGGYDYASVGENRGSSSTSGTTIRSGVSRSSKTASSLPVTRLPSDPLHTIVFDIPRGAGCRGLLRTGPPVHVANIFSVTASSATSTLEIKVTDRFGNQWSESRWCVRKAFTKKV